MIALAFTDVQLRPEQRAQVERLAADTEARFAPAQAARRDLTLAIAAQAEAGQIDRGALQPKIDAMSAAWQNAAPAHRAALEQLHAILDTEQRTAFVDALQTKMQAARAEHADQGEHSREDRMQEWATYLQLTDAQKAQIKDGIHQRFEAMRAQHGQSAPAGENAHHGHHGPDGEARENGGPTRMLESFKSDNFVMEDHPHADREHGDPQAFAGKMVDHRIRFIEAVLPILTPQQRALAAQKIRTDASDHGFEGHL